MNVHRFIIVIFLVVLVGIILVWQNSQVVSSGYSLNEANRHKELVEERVKVRAFQLTSVKSPASVADIVLKMELGLEPVSLTPVATRKNGR